jgi:amino-acid N-acetyltransferase
MISAAAPLQSVSIRPARPGEGASVARIVNATPDCVSVTADEAEAWLHRTFVLVSPDDEIEAVGALRPYRDGLVEIRSLAVAADRRGRGIGSRLLRALLEMAAAHGRRAMCVTQRPEFFVRHGFIRFDAPRILHRREYADDSRRVAMIQESGSRLA